MTRTATCSWLLLSLLWYCEGYTITSAAWDSAVISSHIFAKVAAKVNSSTETSEINVTTHKGSFEGKCTSTLWRLVKMTYALCV